MPRPRKWRWVGVFPPFTFFIPAGISPGMVEEVILNFEEVEALRLKELEGFEQEECARRMGISRPTFQRILESARRKVAEAIVRGKALRVDGGNFLSSWQRLRCSRDGYEWTASFEDLVDGEVKCPSCNGRDVERISSPGFPGRGRYGWGWRR